MISVIHNPLMSIWLFDTSAFNKRADGGGADVQATGDVARFYSWVTNRLSTTD